MEETKIALYQPNVITQARYLFSEYEMRIFLYVVRSIQDKLNKNDVEFNRTLFGDVDYKLQFRLSDLMHEGEKNHERIKKALVELRSKSFEVEDNKQWFNVGFINYGRYLKQEKKAELQVSFLLMPYMVSLAKGFTTYQLETILLLNTYSQRLYMLFSQFRDTSIYRIKASELRNKLGLDDKYDTYANFKSRVITSSEKELKALFNEGKSDVWGKLESDKKDRGKEDFDRLLTFKVFYSERKFKQDEQAKNEDMRYCGNILNAILPDEKQYCNKLLGHLVGKKYLKPFADRMARLEEQAQEEGKPFSSYAPLLKHIAKDDFKFKFKKDS
jgi:hypothetical protein